MDLNALNDPVFIAKIIDFVVFVVALVFLWVKVVAKQLEELQAAQNRQVDDAQQALADAKAALVKVQDALDVASADAKRMVEFGAAQADRIVADELTEAEEHAKRIAGHASGELDRERYRVRRELLEETVEKAHEEARRIVADELDHSLQRALVERLMNDLERSHA